LLRELAAIYVGIGYRDAKVSRLLASIHEPCVKDLGWQYVTSTGGGTD